MSVVVFALVFIFIFFVIVVVSLQPPFTVFCLFRLLSIYANLCTQFPRWRTSGAVSVTQILGQPRQRRLTEGTSRLTVHGVLHLHLVKTFNIWAETFMHRSNKVLESELSEWQSHVLCGNHIVAALCSPSHCRLCVFLQAASSWSSCGNSIRSVRNTGEMLLTGGKSKSREKHVPVTLCPPYE